MVRSHGLIITPDIINNGTFSLSDILITTFWYPFFFKASKEPFSWGIVLTAATTTYTLRHTITTRHGFSEYLTGIMRALIRAK